MAKIVKTACQGCHPECGLLVHVEDGRVKRITGDPDHPSSKGFSCPKGRAQHELLYHPDRVTRPLRRIGGPGSGQWEPVSWDSALDDIAGRLTAVRDQHGSQAIGAYHGTGPRAALYSMRLLGAAIGTPNVISTDLHICAGPSHVAETVTYGRPIMMERGPEYLRSQCILVVGGNPLVSHPPRGIEILKAHRDNGARLIVVDPRRTRLAAEADLWMRVRPGGDIALIMAMIHTIIAERLYDERFVENWCVGFDDLAERAAAYPPESVQDTTWVPPDQIREAARMYASARPGTIHHRVGTEQNFSSTQTNRALAIMIGLTGNIDVPGGNVFIDDPQGYVSSGNLYMGPHVRLGDEIESRRIGAASYPLISGLDAPFPFVHAGETVNAMLGEGDYPLRAIVCAGANPVVNVQNSRRAYEAFKRLDLLVVADFFMTPTCELADYVLPSTMWLERDEPCERQYMNCISVRQKAVAPVGETRQDIDIVIDLVRRLPWANQACVPWRDMDELNDYRLSGIGLSFDDLKERGYIPIHQEYRKYERRGFATPSRKVELRSSVFEKHGFDPLPGDHRIQQGLVEQDVDDGAYPLVLLTGARNMEYYHSLGIQVPRLRRKRPYPEIAVHRDTASDLGLAEGDWAWLEASTMPGDGVRLRCTLVDDVDPRVVSAAHAWWYPERREPTHGCFESNVSVLLADGPRREPVCGSVVLRGVPCRLSRIEPDPSAASS